MFRMVKEKRLYKNYENSIYWIYPWYSEMLSYPGTLVLWRVHFESNASCRICKWTGELSFLLIRDSLWFSFQPEKTSEAAVVDPESQVWHFLPQSSSSNSAVLSRQSYMIINSLLLLAMQFVNGNWWKITFAKRRVQTNIFNVSLFVECHIRVVNIPPQKVLLGGTSWVNQPSGSSTSIIMYYMHCFCSPRYLPRRIFRPKILRCSIA